MLTLSFVDPDPSLPSDDQFCCDAQPAFSRTSKQVREFYAAPASIEAARKGQPMPGTAAVE